MHDLDADQRRQKAHELFTQYAHSVGETFPLEMAIEILGNDIKVLSETLDELKSLRRKEQTVVQIRDFAKKEVS